MATPPTLVQMAFAAGLDESQQDEVLDPAKGFLSLQNGRQDRRGGYSKRLGFAGLAVTRSGASDRSAGRRLFAHKGVPTVIDGTHVDSYVEAAATNVTRSRIPECSYSTVGLPTPAASAVLYDVEYCNGFAAVTYGVTLNGVCKVAVVDAVTGAVIRSPETIGAAAGLALVGSHSSRYFIAFVREDSGTNITAHLFDTQSPSTGWTSLATVVAASASAKPAICSLSNRVAIVYGITTGTDRVVVKTYSSAGLLETANVPTSSNTPRDLAISGSVAGTLWVAWEQADLVRVLGLDADVLATTLASVATAITIPGANASEDIGICEGSVAGTARVWALTDATPATVMMASVTTVATVATPGSTTTAYGIRPTSRPFLQGDRYYMACYPSANSSALVTTSSNGQGLCVVIDWTDDVAYFRPVANISPGLAVASIETCKIASVGSGRHIFGVQTTTSGVGGISGVILGSATLSSALLTLDFATRDRWQPVDHANATFLGGALLSVYDGERVTEAGFIAAPTTPTATLGGTGITGTVRCVAIYEDVDTAGNWVVSGISSVSAVTTPANQTITWRTQSLTTSSRITKGTARVAWYRTLLSGEPPYYRLGVTANDTSASTVTFSDAVDDATLAANAKLYAPNLPGSAGESQDRRAPPGLVHLESYAGMLVGARGESLFFSGQEVYGEATWFSPVFEVPITGGGDITGLKAQDGALFIFKADRIFVLAGEAPSDNGLQGGLGVPRILATDVGCTEPNSIVATSLGIFFRSVRGIEVLTRAQTVEWVGEAIQATLASYPVVTSAVLDGRGSLVRISLAATEASGAATGNGRTVVFDLSLKAWISVDSVLNGDGDSIITQDACMVYLGNEWRYAWLDPSGNVWTERDTGDGSAHFDGSVWITLSAETAWTKFGGIQGHHHVNKVLLLARKSTRADLSTYLSYDYATTAKTVMTRLADDVDTLSTAIDRIQVEHQMHDEAEGQAIKVKFEDATPTGGTEGNGKGATWIAITFEGVPRQGAAPVPEAGM